MFFEQLNFTGNEAISNNIKLNFNHPIQDLLWCIHKGRIKNQRKYINFIYYENFKDYEEKYYKENGEIICKLNLDDDPDYYINHAKDYLKMGYNIRFNEINDSIIYEKENKMYDDDDEIMIILLNMKLINEYLMELFFTNKKQNIILGSSKALLK